MIKYIAITILLLIAEILYFRIAERAGIVDRPNERSSHSRIVLRGGGIIFLIAAWGWSVAKGFPYPWFLASLTIAAGISFVDDVHSIKGTLRFVVQVPAMLLTFYQLYLMPGVFDLQYLSIAAAIAVTLVALFVFLGAANIFNFMDGINGMIALYCLVTLGALMLLNARIGFIEQSFLATQAIAMAIFAYFNSRPKDKAVCFCGDVGAIGIAFLILFDICALILKTGDFSWLVSLLMLYGVDGTLTLIHRLMLHENLLEGHRKNVFHIMANELGFSHITVSAIYAALQLAVSLVMIYIIPDAIAAHWIYALCTLAVFCLVYVWFIRRFFHLHLEFLQSQEINKNTK